MKSCKPVVCWADFAEIGIKLLDSILKAMPCGTSPDLIEPFIGVVSHLVLYTLAFDAPACSLLTRSISNMLMLRQST